MTLPRDPTYNLAPLWMRLLQVDDDAMTNGERETK